MMKTLGRSRWGLLFEVALLFCMVLMHAQAHAGARVALLIGNAKYVPGLPPLSNPLRDVKSLETSLRRLDFEVKVVTDQDLKGMSTAVREFGSRSQGADMAFFYYSGHGMQSRAGNYLIPVTAKLESEDDLEIEALPLKGLLRQLEDARPKTAVVVLDACRDNPVAGKSKSATKGLGRVQNQPVNTLVVFAAQEGNTAEDNGVFARELSGQLVQPGVSLRTMFDNVGRSVRAATGNKQSIQRDDQLSEDVVLLASLKPELAAATPVAPSIPSSVTQATSAPVVTPLGSSAAPVDAETALWNEVKSSGQVDYIQTYINQYPKGKYLGLARLELKKLQDQQFALEKQKELQSWEAAKAANTAEAYEAYGRQYPSGAYVALAQTAAKRIRSEAQQKAQELKERQEREARELKAGQLVKDCSDCPEMVVVPGGSFMMGSSAQEQAEANGQGLDKQLTDRENPQHRVEMPRFLMGKTTITVAQWRAFATETAYKTDAERDAGGKSGCRGFDLSAGQWAYTAGRSWSNPGWAIKETEPVVCVSFNDAQAYTKWLSKKTGKDYRLPTESQWEYAARAGTVTSRYWGDDVTLQCAYANGTDQTPWPAGSNRRWNNPANCSDGYFYVAPVGSYRPNAYGLYDVLGNVLQWTQDCWNDTYLGAPADGSAWATGDCSLRVLRGGSWISGPARLRSALRGGNTSGDRINYIGFRLARTF